MKIVSFIIGVSIITILSLFIYCCCLINDTEKEYREALKEMEEENGKRRKNKNL